MDQCPLGWPSSREASGNRCGRRLGRTGRCRSWLGFLRLYGGQCVGADDGGTEQRKSVAQALQLPCPHILNSLENRIPILGLSPFPKAALPQLSSPLIFYPEPLLSTSNP